MKTKTMKTKKMKTMKKMKILAYMFITGLFTACSSGDDNDTPTPIVPTSYSGEITEDVTWTSDNIYTLDGRVMVTNGATLTIEAGTVIRGAEGIGADASCLIIARGAKMANGTASNPMFSRQ